MHYMSEAEIYSLRPAGEKEPPEDTGTSSAELAEIVRRFINMVERRDEKIAQLEAEIERLNNRLQSLLPQKADLKNTEIYHTEQK